MLETILKKSKSEMANGAVKTEYESRMKPFRTQLKTLKNQLINSVADIGLTLSPSINKF